jgi:hypothetical protein
MGEERTQVVTTGLSGSTSMSLIVDGAVDEVARTLQGRASTRRPSAADLIDLPLPDGSSLS